MRDNPYKAEAGPAAQGTNWRQLATVLLVAMCLLGALVFVGSLGWLGWVFMDSSLMGQGIPPRDFTSDRFGPPIVGMAAGVVIAIVGVILAILTNSWRHS